MSILIESNKNDNLSNSFYIKNAIIFNIENIPVSLANSIRRTILSDIPSISFDDTWNNNEDLRSIHIIKNTSGLHNEFLSHRLSLIPINRYEQSTRDILAIKTLFNINTNKREFKFNMEEEFIPIFKLKAEHVIDTDIKKNNYGLVEVQTNNIEFSEDFSSDIECSKFFQPDLYIKETKQKDDSDEYIILNMLKSKEEIDIYMKPTVGLGKENSRYCTVGTVSYKFNINEDKVENVFNQKIEQENKERIDKHLNIFTDEEIENKKNSFMLLDKERIYRANKYNEPNSFNYCVESIGVLPSHQIVYDSLVMLKLQLTDIIKSFTGFIKEDTNILYRNRENTINNKINVYNSIDNLFGYKIVIQNCSHTLGNLINYYINTLFVDNYKIETGEDEDVRDIPNMDSIDLNTLDLRNFNQNSLHSSGYKMPHPLKEETEFKLKILDTMGEFEIFEKYTKYSLELNSIYNIESGNIANITNTDMKKIIIIYTFVKSIHVINEIITNLLNQWEKETLRVGHEINTPSFIIEDNYTDSTEFEPKLESEPKV